MGLWSLWLIIAVLFLSIELLTLSTAFLYVGIGALAAMVCAIAGGGWVPSIITFVIATAILYLLTYRWRRRLIEMLHKGSEQTATGMEALIGRTGTVVEASDSLRMRIDGDVWKVIPSRDSAPLVPGAEVRVTGYNSIILIVEVIGVPAKSARP